MMVGQQGCMGGSMMMAAIQFTSVISATLVTLFILFEVFTLFTLFIKFMKFILFILFILFMLFILFRKFTLNFVLGVYGTRVFGGCQIVF